MVGQESVIGDGIWLKKGLVGGKIREKKRKGKEKKRKRRKKWMEKERKKERGERKEIKKISKEFSGFKIRIYSVFDFSKRNFSFERFKLKFRFLANTA